MKPIVVIPTYNEKENVAAMAAAVLENLPPEGRLLFLDDNSPDGTGDIIDGLCAAEPRIAVMHRAKKEGLGRAYVAGFAQAASAPQAGDGYGEDRAGLRLSPAAGAFAADGHL